MGQGHQVSDHNHYLDPANNHHDCTDNNFVPADDDHYGSHHHHFRIAKHDDNGAVHYVYRTEFHHHGPNLTAVDFAAYHSGDDHEPCRDDHWPEPWPEP